MCFLQYLHQNKSQQQSLQSGNGLLKIAFLLLNDPTKSEQTVVSCSDWVGLFFACNHCVSRVAGFFNLRHLCHWPETNDSKSESKTWNQGDSNPADIFLFLLLVAAHEQLFYLTWCLVFQCTMEPLRIIKFNVGGKTSLEGCFRCVILSI